MKNALRVWMRDIKRILKVPPAMTVVFFLVVLPSLYTWFNVYGFWDPYTNTGNLHVCVVNEDKPAESELAGTLDLGAQIVDNLQENNQLGWDFTDYETAMDQVNSGSAYAAFVIPENFSSDVASIFSGKDCEQPKIQYYVNEKAGAVSPKITDAGSTTLDETINSTFVSTVSSVVADIVDQKIAESSDSLQESHVKLSDQLDEGSAALNDARAALANLQSKIASAQGSTSDAKGYLNDARDSVDAASDSLKRVSDLCAIVQTDTNSFMSELSPILAKSSITLSGAVTDANDAIGSSADLIRAEQGKAQVAYESAEGALAANEAAAETLHDMANQVTDEELKSQIEDAANSLDSANAMLSSSLSQVKPVVYDSDFADDLIKKSDELSKVALSAIDNADSYSKTLTNETLPTVNSGVTELVNVANSASAAVSAQSVLIGQTSLVLDQLDSTLTTASDAVAQTDDLLLSITDSYSTVRTDIMALTASETYSSILGSGYLDAQKIADFMASPTEVVTEKMYPVNAYGSSMAPLFTNLTLWIGVFMLMVILRQDVDDEGVPNLSIRQRFVGRFLFLLPLVALQAAVCITGNLILGVQTANVALYYLTAIVASIAYLCIQYTLSVTMQHIGKGLCIIMVFAQIPGATGLYPVEMTPSFFRGIYPLMPFTYGINAMRETIGGFYNGLWGYMMLILVAFAIAFFAIGLAVTPFMANLNRMFAKQIRETDIINGGDVHLPARRYRLTQLVDMLSKRSEFQNRVADHASRFFSLYEKLKRGAGIVGIIVPAIMTVFFAVLGFDRVVLLTMWLVWLVSVILFLVVLEKLKDSFEEQVSLQGKSDDELRALYEGRNRYQDIDRTGEIPRIVIDEAKSGEGA